MITQSNVELIVQINELFAHFIFKNKKNKEYFIFKGGISLTSKFIDKQYELFYTDDQLMHSCCAILGNTAVMNDNKILLWVLGVIQPLIDMVVVDLDLYKKAIEEGN